MSDAPVEPEKATNETLLDRFCHWALAHSFAMELAVLLVLFGIGFGLWSYFKPQSTSARVLCTLGTILLGRAVWGVSTRPVWMMSLGYHLILSGAFLWTLARHISENNAGATADSEFWTIPWVLSAAAFALVSKGIETVKQGAIASVVRPNPKGSENAHFGVRDQRGIV